MGGTKDWSPRDPSEAFFPVERRPIYMSSRFALSDHRRLPRHSAVVDVERSHVFAVITAKYELVTNEVAFDVATEVMKQVFHATRMEDMACFNITMPNTFDYTRTAAARFESRWSGR